MKKEADQLRAENLKLEQEVEHLHNLVEIKFHSHSICMDCGSILEEVRPGKHQCDYCDMERVTEQLRAEVERQKHQLDYYCKERNEAQEFGIEKAKECEQLRAEIERLEDKNHALACARDHLLRILEEERKPKEDDKFCCQIRLETTAELKQLRAENEELTNIVSVREAEVTGLLGMNDQLRTALDNMREVARLAQEAAATAETRAVIRCAEIAKEYDSECHCFEGCERCARPHEAIRKEYGL